jgi:hypothetical protein
VAGLLPLIVRIGGSVPAPSGSDAEPPAALVIPGMGKRAVQIGCTGIILSNHGGRQLDGSRAPFDQLAEIVDAVGDRIDVIMDGGIQRGTHVLNALSLGAKAVGVGRFYLFSPRGSGSGGCRARLRPHAGGDSAGDEADGLHVDQTALA